MIAFQLKVDKTIFPLFHILPWRGWLLAVRSPTLCGTEATSFNAPYLTYAV